MRGHFSFDRLDVRTSSTVFCFAVTSRQISGSALLLVSVALPSGVVDCATRPLDRLICAAVDATRVICHVSMCCVKPAGAASEIGALNKEAGKSLHCASTEVQTEPSLKSPGMELGGVILGLDARLSATTYLAVL
ncbi:hypothetical protein K461DRAFT_305011 [Myriangium duriaei CBS 260.36]|uniref:Uncharacterized protein n=1 Tax=Myriangium duriaei CBS 260.36 TaxID=1168546 RepID=A0A9P4J4F7_9PEZI|nr:hypothetical protein K461DRAFT_305011 [Myriangium duriaei CBS 260.36]